MPDGKQSLDIGGTTVQVSNPEKVYFPRTGHTKLDLVRYYLAVAEARCAARADGRWRSSGSSTGPRTSRSSRSGRRVSGRTGSRPCSCSFPSGRTAEEVVLRDAAALAWVANLGCIDLNPHPVRADDLDHPDELRVDLDPVPGVEWAQILDVALVAREVLADFGLAGWPKTSGSRGIHIYARIEPRWTFNEVRRAAWRWPGRSSGGPRDRHRGGGRKSGTASSSTTTRTPRTARWPPPTRSGPPRTPGCPPRWPGTRCPAATPRSSPSTPCPPGSRRSATRGGHGRRGRLAGAAAGPGRPARGGRAAATRPGRRTTTSRPASRHGSSRPSGGRGRRPARAGPARAGQAAPTGRRRSAMPLIEVARAATKDEAMAGLERWKQRHPEVWPHLEPADVLVDSMRGRSYHLDPDPAEPAPRARGRAPAAGSAGGRLRPLAQGEGPRRRG